MGEQLESLSAFDLVLPFQLEAISLRGRLVRLGGSLDTILQQHDYPYPVAKLLAEATVIAGALGSSLKYDGVFTLQTKSDGSVGLLVADVTGDGGIRACAKFDAQTLDASEGNLLGDGYLAFTVDQQAVTERYQGIVKLESDRLDHAIQHYFRQSEQIPTGIVVGVRRDEAGHWCGGCLMIQRMPHEGGLGETAQTNVTTVDTAQEEDWHRAMLLLRTCTMQELTDPSLQPEQLLYRLFHEEGVRIFEAKPFYHQCRCSQERVDSMIASLPADEVSALADNGCVSVTCEFCNKTYGHFTKDCS